MADGLADGLIAVVRLLFTDEQETRSKGEQNRNYPKRIKRWPPAGDAEHDASDEQGEGDEEENTSHVRPL